MLWWIDGNIFIYVTFIFLLNRSGWIYQCNAKMSWVECNKHKEFVYCKTSYIFDKFLVLFISCSKCGDNNNRIFREEEII